MKSVVITNKNWELLFKNATSKIELSYVRKRMLQTADPIFMDIPPRKISSKKLILEVKEQFLYNADKNIYHAFVSLRKRLPVLAENLLMDCYEHKVMYKNIFSKVFGMLYAYSMKDRTIFSTQIKRDRMLELFRYCNPNVLMNIGGRNRLKKLDNTVTIYRGAAGRTVRQAIAGLSWTLEYGHAATFAKFNYKFFKVKSCFVIKAQINKKHILAYIHSSGRGEHELILDSLKISGSQIMRIRKSDIPEIGNYIV